MAANHVQLSSSFTVARYRALEAAADRKELGQFVRERFDERYFWPIENSGRKHGFTSLAVACIVIETLEAFYQGRGDTLGASKQMFRDFFSKRDTPLKGLGAGPANWFYLDIRCGILHQAEARNGWRVWRRGPLLDTGARTINATKILRALRRAVTAYAGELQSNDGLWELFKKKMDVVCKNCS